MLHDILPVAEDFRALIARADVQKQPMPRRNLGKGECPAVPEKLPGRQGFSNAGKLRFGRKRNENLSVPGIGFRVRLCNGVVPETVQVFIAFAHELRARIFL